MRTKRSPGSRIYKLLSLRIKTCNLNKTGCIKKKIISIVGENWSCLCV